MRRTARLFVVSMTLLLAGAACSGEGGTSDSDADATGGEATSSSPSASESPEAEASPVAEPEAPEVLDPCAMVPEQTWQPLLAAKRRDHVELKRFFTTQSGILIDDPRVRYACVVTFDDNENTPVSWGYYPGDYDSKDLQKLLDGPGGTSIYAKVGFLAFTTGDFTSSDAVGIVGNTGLFVSVAEKSDSIIKGGRTKERTLIAMMKALGDQVDPAAPQPEILLPELCPAVDSPELVAVRGRVDIARGGDDGNGHQWCLYLDRRAGSQLRLEAYHFTDEYFQTFYDQTKGNPNGVDMFDGPPGQIRMISVGEDGSADSIVLDPDSHDYVDANLQYQQTKRRKLDRRAFIELAGAYFESVAAAATDD